MNSKSTKETVNFLALTRMAKANNSFIFRKSTKKWYTPEELTEAVPHINVTGNKGETLLPASDFVVMDPFAAVRYYNKWLKSLTEMICEIENKISDNYTVKFSAKNKKS
ncbi:hypothetical protein ACR79T_10130 [Sphingobacterium spiritivorum]|uniref:hypothetical protein n=1 Tax=Sphingobacterium spiritivorum TaxID=258 RepID=UPI003DA2669D